MVAHRCFFSKTGLKVTHHPAPKRVSTKPQRPIKESLCRRLWSWMFRRKRKNGYFPVASRGPGSSSENSLKRRDRFVPYITVETDDSEEDELFSSESSAVPPSAASRQTDSSSTITSSTSDLAHGAEQFKERY